MVKPFIYLCCDCWLRRVRPWECEIDCPYPHREHDLAPEGCGEEGEEERDEERRLRAHGQPVGVLVHEETVGKAARAVEDGGDGTNKGEEVVIVDESLTKSLNKKKYNSIRTFERKLKNGNYLVKSCHRLRDEHD